MLTFWLLLAIPVVTLALTRRVVISFLVSSCVGVPPLWRTMVVLETQAADSDFDIIFGLGMMFWAFVLVVVYGVVFAVVALLAHKGT